MTFGKVMGGGFPAAAFGGRADVMARLAPDGPVYQAGTLSGNPIATTAGLATLRLATDEVYAHLTAAGDTIKAAAAEALTAAGVAHVIQATGTMFSVFFTDRGRSRDFAGASAHRHGGVRRVLPRHARRGVYLPPSAYEAWFLSAAHDDRAVQTVLDALPPPPAPPPPPATPEGADDRHDTIVHLLRHGEVHNPDGVLYGRRDGLPPLRLGRQMAQRVADTIGDRDIVHLRASPLERAQETAQPLADGPRPRHRHRRAGDRVDQRLEGQQLRRRRGALRQPEHLAAPVEPVPAVVGRALQGRRRPDDGGRAGRPRGRPRATRP